jgi:hypothetical protein
MHTQPHAGSTERVHERGLQRKLSLLSGLQAETVREERKKRQESSRDRASTPLTPNPHPNPDPDPKPNPHPNPNPNPNQESSRDRDAPTQHYAAPQDRWSHALNRLAANKPTGSPSSSPWILTQPPRSYQPGR